MKTGVETSHYVKKEHRQIHASFLNSKAGDRELSDFYATTYIMPEKEMRYCLNYLEEEDVDKAIENTHKIGDMIENYTLKKRVRVPKMKLPEFELKHIFKKGYEQYDYINKFAHSEEDQDRYLLKLIEDGFLSKIKYQTLSKEEFYEYVKRIDTELGEMWEITKEIQTTISSYYITTREVIQIMWEEGDSLIGVGRGSACGFCICYLIDITQLNPIEWDLPHWRHLSKERGAELPKLNWALVVNLARGCVT